MMDVGTFKGVAWASTPRETTEDAARASTVKQSAARVEPAGAIASGGCEPVES